MRQHTGDNLVLWLGPCNWFTGERPSPGPLVRRVRCSVQSAYNISWRGSWLTIAFSSNMFRLERTDSKGTVMVATQDLLPGEVIFVETEPLLSVSPDTISKYESFPKEARFYLAAYECFCALSPPHIERYLALCASGLEKVGAVLRKLGDAALSGKHSLELQKFSHVGTIWRANAFSLPLSHHSVVYELASRISHSCCPSAHLLFNGVECSCLAVQAIKAGDEITIDYYPHDCLHSVTERQSVLLDSKEFTCHCQRCDAAGDDTRQFRCENRRCPGVHYVRNHPRESLASSLEENVAAASSGDVLLLPCGICGCPASPAYMAACAADEAQVADVALQLRGTRVLEDIAGWTEGQCRRMLLLLRAQPELLWHATSGPLLRVALHAAHRLHALELDGRHVQALVEVGERYARWLEHVHPFRSTQLAAECGEVIVRSLVLCPSAAHPAAVAFTLRTLRMVLILYHRPETGRKHLDAALRTLSWAPGPPHDLRRCAYCEEAPDRAALTLRLCGRCRQAAYCSVGCQQAHWKVHKGICAAQTS